MRLAAPLVSPAEVPSVALVLVALVLLAVATALTAGESALTRVTRSALDDSAEEDERGEERGRERLARAYALVEDRHTTMTGIAVVRMIVDMAAAAALTLVFATLLDSWWLVLLAGALAALVLVLLLAGVSPRSMGRRSPVPVLVATGPLLSVVSGLLRPLVGLTGRLRPASPQTHVEARAEMAEDLREMVDSVVESEEFEPHDRELVRSVFELGYTLAREVMVPRTDMVTIDAGSDLDDAVALHVRSGYSRIPVVGDNVDDVRGVVYVKDIVRRTHRSGGAPAESPVDEVMRPAAFVPETKPVDDLLREMQREAVHIAFAVDEYGGIAGLVTIEDLLEEIVGEMTDEHDRSEPEIEEVEAATGPDQEGRVVRVPARTPIDEVGELFGLEIEDDDVDTIGGLLAKALGRVPIVGSGGTALGLHMVLERVEGRRKRPATMLVSLAAPEGEGDEHTGSPGRAGAEGSVGTEGSVGSSAVRFDPRGDEDGARTGSHVATIGASRPHEETS